MNLKKIITAFVLSLVLFFAPFTANTVKAEELMLSDHVQILSSGHLTVLDFFNEGGQISDENVNALYEVTGNAVISAEAIKSQVETEEYDRKYRNKHTDVLRVFKNSVIYLLENSYNEDEFSPSENGLVAINKKLSEVKGSIAKATTYQAIEESALSFMEYIISDQPAKKIDTLSTDSDQPISVVIQSSNLVFSEDDAVKTKLFVDSAIIKNTKVALIDNENLLDPTSGVACYFSIRLSRNGVNYELSKVLNQPIAFAIEIADLGVDLNEESCVQIARYTGNRQVAFINEVLITGGYLCFTLSESLESDYELDFAIVAKGYALNNSSTLVAFTNKLGITTAFETIADALMGIDLFSSFEKHQIVDFVIGAVALILVPLVLALLYFIFRMIVKGVKFAKRERYAEFKCNYRRLKKDKRKLNKKNKTLNKEHAGYRKFLIEKEKEKKRSKKQKQLEKRQARIELRQKRLEERKRRKNKYTEEN